MIDPDSSRLLLRLEGAAVLAVAVGIYAVYGASWWWFAGLFLLPDAFMVGYLSNPRVGAVVYNLGHTYVTPLLLGGIAFALKASFLGSVALIWTAHIGLDRLLGYGLKAPTGFHSTHLTPSPESP
jgi:hypothetical protein